MTYTYDAENIFSKILKGDIPANVVHETEYSLAFVDINPQAPIHILVIPKGSYVNYDHFIEQASAEEVQDFTRAIATVIKNTNHAESDKGYRLLINTGPDGGQEVPHLHAHVLGGKPLGPMLVT